MKIRSEQETDFEKVYRLVKSAFETAEHCDGDEQEYVLKLRAGENYLPSLALVAEDNGKLIGHIMLTKTHISSKTKNIEALLLSPICVLAEYRRKGVGAELINEALTRGRAAGYKAVFLCGDPAYYSRFGFKPVSSYNIKYTMNAPSKYVLTRELQAGWLENIEGTITIV